MGHLGEIYRNKWTKLVKVCFLDVLLPLVWKKTWSIWKWLPVVSPAAAQLSCCGAAAVPSCGWPTVRPQQQGLSEMIQVCSESVCSLKHDFTMAAWCHMVWLSETKDNFTRHPSFLPCSQHSHESALLSPVRMSRHRMSGCLWIDYWWRKWSAFLCTCLLGAVSWSASL